MCVGIPMQIVSVDGLTAQAANGSVVTVVDLSLTGAVEPGTWVLTFLGAARQVLAPDEAEKIIAALQGLERVMDGGELGDAFADLENRTPELPPHLSAALAAGKTRA